MAMELKSTLQKTSSMQGYSMLGPKMDSSSSKRSNKTTKAPSTMDSTTGRGN